MKRYGWALALALVAGIAPAQALATEQDGEIWTSAWAHGPVSGKMLVSIDASLRSSDRGTSAPTVLIRPLIGVQATKTLSLWTGYTYAASAPNGRADIKEHRAVQQATWAIGKIGRGTLLSRTRVETRWVDGRAGTGWRIRQMVRYAQPMGETKALLVLQSEPFINLNTTGFGQSAGFDQIRNFIGVNAPMAKGLAIEGGYMNRYIRRSGAEDRIDHILPITAVYRF